MDLTGPTSKGREGRMEGKKRRGNGEEDGGEEKVRNGRVEEWEGLRWVVSEQKKRKGKGKGRRDGTVSYTHLTLPTIYSV